MLLCRARRSNSLPGRNLGIRVPGPRSGRLQKWPKGDTDRRQPQEIARNRRFAVKRVPVDLPPAEMGLECDRDHGAGSSGGKAVACSPAGSPRALLASHTALHPEGITMKLCIVSLALVVLSSFSQATVEAGNPSSRYGGSRKSASSSKLPETTLLGNELQQSNTTLTSLSARTGARKNPPQVRGRQSTPRHW